MEMGCELKEMLKNVCVNGGWDYAVFWKIKHGAGARMVLTWEDDYHKNRSKHDPFKNKIFDETIHNFADGHHHYDSLRLAAAKMSSRVYSLGEGIIGQVAATGEYQWIFADNSMTYSSTSFECADEWRAHFSAGVKTLIFVAVVPLGVVQLGSFNKVPEDMKLVKHIRDVFFTYQALSPSQRYSPNHIINSLHMPYPYTKGSGVEEGMQNKYSSMLQCLDKSSNSPTYAVSRPGIHQRETVDHLVLDSALPPGNDIDKLLESKSIFCNPEYHERAHLKLLDGREPLIDSSAWRDENAGTKHFSPHMQNPYMEEGLYTNALSANNSHADFSHLTSDMFYRGTSDVAKLNGANSVQSERLPIQNPSMMQLKEVQKKNAEAFSESSYTNISNTSFKFSAGSELLEALGSSFSKQSHCDWETEMTEVGTSTSSKLPEATHSSPLSSDSVSDNLLEAVVANIFQNRSDSKSEKSSHNPVHSTVTTGLTPELDNHNKQSIVSVSRSIDQSSIGQESYQHGPSRRSEQIEKSSEPVNTNKKRAKPGENCRPRPRDRQLIQDRIKELRELVPSGSKCSIDALLERTIKHMLFLHSITKHSDKLQKCAESKLCNKKSGVPGFSNFEQGSSWAVEVGSHLKVCTIIVENLNVNGQMLVEMLCEECSHFLEIAEAIRSLGLTILKGITESHGEKTWICFVVEGQNDKSMHRMDILWSLVRIFQPETTTSSHSSPALKDAAM